MNSRRTNLDELKDSSARPVALFLDDGGVLNDNSLRAPEWLRLIGDFMPALMGGTVEQWAAANAIVFPQVWGDLRRRLSDFAIYRQFERAYAINWMRGMCAAVGVAIPPDDDAVALHRELSIYVSERANATFAGAGDAVVALHRAGYMLYMASGTPSWELRGILAKMGIAEMFTEFYGPDLVDRVKYGRGYYEEIFAHAGVAPTSALIIESDAECCDWASEASARAVWIDAGGRGDATSLASLVDALV